MGDVTIMAKFAGLEIEVQFMNFDEDPDPDLVNKVTETVLNGLHRPMSFMGNPDDDWYKMSYGLRPQINRQMRRDDEGGGFKNMVGGANLNDDGELLVDEL